MNQTFSRRRFVLMNRWFWTTNGRTYSLGLAAFLTITVLMLARVLVHNEFDRGISPTNFSFFVLLTVPVTGLLGVHVFDTLHNQHSALPYLMLPASRTEKFMVAILYLLIFLVGFSLFYVATEALFFQIANGHLPTTGKHYASEFLRTADDQPNRQELMPLAYLLLILAGISSISSLYFRQGVFVKNAVSVLGLFLLLTFMYGLILRAFFPDLETQAGNIVLLGDLQILVSPDDIASALRLAPNPFIEYVLPWLLLLALWVAARIRFNEIER